MYIYLQNITSTDHSQSDTSNNKINNRVFLLLKIF